MPQIFAAAAAKARVSLRTWFGRTVLAGVALSAIAVSAMLTAFQGPDLNILLYPLPVANYEPSLRITGLAEPEQRLRIVVDQKTAVIARSNASGDFAATLVLAAGTHTIQVIGDNKRFKPSLSAIYRVHQAASMPAPSLRAKSAKSANTPIEQRPPPGSGGEFSIQSASAPTITPPPTTSSANPITVSGTAQPSSTVSFYVNGQFTRSVVASAGGTFSTWVPLEDGLNSVYATATDATGESPPSNTVDVTYTNTIPRTYSATTIAQNTVWTAGSTPTYTLNGHMTIAPGATLWIQPGVNVNISGYYRILAQGAFVVRGDAALRAVFRPTSVACTATSNGRADWIGVEADIGGSADIEYGDFHCAEDAIYFDSAIGSVRHSRFLGNATAIWTKGGGLAPVITGENEVRNSNYGVYVSENSHPVVSGNNLITGNDYGVYVVGGTAANPLPSVNGNSIYANTAYNYFAANFLNSETVVLNARDNWWGTTDPVSIAQKIRDRKLSASAPYVDYGGFLASAGGAPAYTGSTLIGPVTQNSTLASGDYLLLSDLVVNPGVTLTLSPGATVMSVPGARVLVNGNLQAVGISAQRVRFGSAAAYPAAEDWYGIEVSGVGASANLDYVRIEHATHGVRFSGGQGAIARSLLRFCRFGVYVGPKSNPTIHLGNQISHNRYGIYVLGNNAAADNPQPVANGNSLFENSDYNYYTQGFVTPKPTLNATGNWWGTAVESAIVAKIYTGASSSTTVNYSGYLSAEPIPQAMLLTGFSMSVQHVKPLISSTPAAGTFTINRSGTVTYRVVRDADGLVVRQWTQAYAAPGQYAFAWDGLNDQGGPPSGGLHRMVLIASDGLDPYVYDIAPATGTIFAPNPTDAYNPYLNDFFKFSFNFTSPATMSLLITPQGGTAFYALENAFYPVGTQWIHWNGRSPDGALLTAPSVTYSTDGFVLRTTGVYVFTPAVTITGNGAAPNIEVKSDPYFVTHSYDQASRIVYRIDADAVVRVAMLPYGVVDPASPSAVVLVDNVALSAKDGNGNPIDHIAE